MILEFLGISNCVKAKISFTRIVWKYLGVDCTCGNWWDCTVCYITVAARMTCTGLRVTVCGTTSAGRIPPIQLRVSTVQPDQMIILLLAISVADLLHLFASPKTWIHCWHNTWYLNRKTEHTSRGWENVYWQLYTEHFRTCPKLFRRLCRVDDECTVEHKDHLKLKCNNQSLILLLLYFNIFIYLTIYWGHVFIFLKQRFYLTVSFYLFWELYYSLCHHTLSMALFPYCSFHFIYREIINKTTTSIRHQIPLTQLNVNWIMSQG